MDMAVPRCDWDHPSLWALVDVDSLGGLERWIDSLVSTCHLRRMPMPLLWDTERSIYNVVFQNDVAPSKNSHFFPFFFFCNCARDSTTRPPHVISSWTQMHISYVRLHTYLKDIVFGQNVSCFRAISLLGYKLLNIVVCSFTRGRIQIFIFLFSYVYDILEF